MRRARRAAAGPLRGYLYEIPQCLRMHAKPSVLPHILRIFGMDHQQTESLLLVFTDKIYKYIYSSNMVNTGLYISIDKFRTYLPLIAACKYLQYTHGYKPKLLYYLYSNKHYRWDK